MYTSRVCAGCHPLNRGLAFFRTWNPGFRYFSDKPSRPSSKTSDSTSSGSKNSTVRASTPIFTVRVPTPSVSTVPDAPQQPRAPLTWFQRFVRRITEGHDTFNAAAQMWSITKTHCADPVFLEQCSLPQDRLPRLALRALHVWILHQRLNEDMKEAGKEITYRLYEEMWDDFEDEMEAEGVFVTSKLKETAQGAIYGGLRAYDKTLELAGDSNDHTLYLGALWRNLYMGLPQLNRAHLIQMRDYIVEQRLRIQDLPEETFYHGSIEWGTPGRAVPSEEASRLVPELALKPMFTGGPPGSESSFVYERSPTRTLKFERSKR